LSQTPWVVDGKRKSEFSVEELICKPINEAVLATEWRFSASGREDVDVRMLGNGRPFVIEFINPHRVNFTREQLNQLQVVQ
jgi:tRNA pseudouridine synthase 10